MEIADGLGPDSRRRPYTIFDEQRRAQLTAGTAPRAQVEPSPGADRRTQPAWEGDDRIMLAPDALLLQPLGGEGEGRSVILSRTGRLDVRLTLPDELAWVLDLLRALASGAPCDVATLAERTGQDATTVRPVLAQLHEQGWLLAADTS